MPDEKHFDRLTDVVKSSFEEQANERILHRELTEYIKGNYYPRRQGEAPGFETAINLISMAYRGLARNTISKSPRIQATPKNGDPAFQSWAENSEMATNEWIQETDLATELADCARQSMASMGVFFIGPEYVGEPKKMRLELAMKSIAREDFVHDCNSKRLVDSDIQGHLERMPVQDVRDNPLFDESARSKVDASGGVGSGDETRLRNFLRGRKTELYDYTDIWCVYERRRNKLVYYPAEQRELKLLEMDWTGPKPYRYLGYEWVTGHPIPIAPLQHLIRKHRAFNLLDIKTIHQAQKAKLLFGYTNASKEEAKTMLRSVDNEFVLQENGAIRTMHVGGASADTVAMAEKQRRDFSYAAGNLDQYLGLSPQAPTLGQERLLAGAANEMIDDMSGWAHQFVKGVAEDIFWWHLRDPNPEPMVFRKQIPGSDYTYPMLWTKEHRQFVAEMKFQVDVEPYSYVERSPSARLADYLGAVQIMMGLMDMMLAQGMSIDVEAIFRYIAKQKNLPELYDAFILNQNPMELQQLLGGPRRESSSPPEMGGPRRYIRESRSDGSGEAMELMRAMSRGQQEAQVA